MNTATQTGRGRTSNKQIFKEDTLSYPNLEHSFHSINKTSDVNIYLLVILSPWVKIKELEMREGPTHGENEADVGAGKRMRLRDIPQERHLGGPEKQNRKLKELKMKEKDSWLH